MSSAVGSVMKRPNWSRPWLWLAKNAAWACGIQRGKSANSSRPASQ